MTPVSQRPKTYVKKVIFAKENMKKISQYILSLYLKKEKTAWSKK